MTEPVTPVFVPAEEGHAFEAYTVFPPAEEALEQYLGAKAKVQLPERHRQMFVRFLPWIAVVFLPFHFAAVLLLLGVTGLAALFGSFSFIGAVIATGVFVLELIALPGLFGKSRRGWAFYVYALAVSTIGNLVRLSLFGLLMSVLFAWIAFQIKYHYR